MNFNKPRYRRLKVLIKFSFVFLFVFNLKLTAQDIHFSQLHAVPLHINAANTGSGEADFRLFNLFRNQWRKIDVPYNTFQFAADSKFRLYKRQFGIGGILIHDESSSSYLTANKLYLSLSHAFYYGRSRFVAGLQPGFVIKQFDSRRITFGSQFNPDSETFDPALPDNENNLNNKLDYFDLNAGVLWQTRLKGMKPGLGFAMSHINRPVESFHAQNDSTRLPVKYMVSGQIYIPLLKRLSLEPQFIYTSARQANDLVFGLLGAYYPDAGVSPVKRIYGLSHYRVNPARTLDALILGLGLQYLDFDVCVSYDLNVSSLRQASRYQGAFEISVVYIRNRNSVKSAAQPCIML
jgi:type IX secretion system PorP/SprF family membrane protein